jgi:hypothetical protein
VNIGLTITYMDISELQAIMTCTKTCWMTYCEELKANKDTDKDRSEIVAVEALSTTEPSLCRRFFVAVLPQQQA